MLFVFGIYFWYPVCSDEETRNLSKLSYVKILVKVPISTNISLFEHVCINGCMCSVKFVEEDNLIGKMSVVIRG